MNAKNQSREWRRARARRDALANQIAGAVAAGLTPHAQLVAEWESAAQRTDKLDRKADETK